MSGMYGGYIPPTLDMGLDCMFEAEDFTSPELLEQGSSRASRLVK